MEMVPADRVMKVWGKLNVPESLVEMISKQFSTTKEKTRGCVDLYLNCYPNDKLSWRDITGALYIYGEMAAAREAKSFYHQYGEQQVCVEAEKVCVLKLKEYGSIHCSISSSNNTLATCTHVQLPCALALSCLLTNPHTCPCSTVCCWTLAL